MASRGRTKGFAVGKGEKGCACVRKGIQKHQGYKCILSCKIQVEIKHVKEILFFYSCSCHVARVDLLSLWRIPPK